MLHLLCLLRYVIALVLSLQLVNPAAAAEPEWLYAVNPGDTLISVAAGYLVNPNDWRKLQKLNDVTEPRRLIPGTKLRLPVALLKREAVIADVIHVHGKVTHTAKNGRPQNLIAGARLEVGDMIETSTDASVSMRFVDGSRLLLIQNTQVTLAEMILFGKTGMAKTIIELNRGSLDNHIAEQQKPAARYEIKSRALNLVVRGTQFRAHVNAIDQVSRSEVIDGAMEASGTRGETVTVLAGFGTLAVPGESPRVPQALSLAPDLSLVPSLLQRVPLRFEWPAAVGAERYHAQVFSDRSFERLLLDGVFQGNAANWSDLPDGRYVLRVRSIDSNGLEGANADREFMLKARPEFPVISAPQDGQKVYGSQATLRWNTSNAAHSYHVQLAAKPDFSELLVDLPEQVNNEYTVPLAPGQYYWRIASVAAEQNQGPFSDVQSFTQRKIPESPQLEPPQIDDKRLMSHWHSREAGEKFQVQVARNPDFTQPIMDTVVNVSESQIDNLKPGIYYLRVKTIDADGFAGPFGPVQQIEVPTKTNYWWLLLLLVPFAL